MLKVEGLTKYYDDLLAVNDLSFEMAAGEVLGLLGPNGAGKTTVLRSLAGIVQPTRGRVVINGFDLAQAEVDAKRQLGFVPEVPSPYDLLTVWEHVEFVARAYGEVEGVRQRGEALLRRLDLEEKSRELVLTLSKGMKQKLAIACAFVHSSRLILFDEPIIGIDPRGQHAVKELVKEAQAEGRSVLISTHILSTAEEMCDRILILSKGVAVAEGSLAELHQRAHLGDERSLEDVFLSLTEEQTDHASAPEA